MMRSTIIRSMALVYSTPAESCSLRNGNAADGRCRVGRRGS